MWAILVLILVSVVVMFGLMGVVLVLCFGIGKSVVIMVIIGSLLLITLVAGLILGLLERTREPRRRPGGAEDHPADE